MSYAYATTDETIADVLTEVTDSDQIETVGRLIASVSAFIDRFTNRPAAYFLPIFDPIGTKQKINILVDADGLLQDSAVRLTLTAAGLEGSPLATTIDADFPTDDSASIAIQLNNAVNGVAQITDFLDIAIGVDGISLDIEMKAIAPLDPTFSATIEGVGPGTGVVTTNSTVVNAGSYSASQATARRYRGNGKNYLQIGRHIAGSVSVENVGPDLWYEHPENGWLFAVDVAGQPGTGYESDDYTYRVGCDLFSQNALYLVSARWGFASTPDDIVMATKQIVQQIWDRGKGVIGQISPTGFVIERDIPLTARAMLDGWTKREFEIN